MRDGQEQWVTSKAVKKAGCSMWAEGKQHRPCLRGVHAAYLKQHLYVLWGVGEVFYLR